MVAPYASSESGDTYLGCGAGGAGVGACVLLRAWQQPLDNRVRRQAECVDVPSPCHQRVRRCEGRLHLVMPSASCCRSQDTQHSTAACATIRQCIRLPMTTIALLTVLLPPSPPLPCRAASPLPTSPAPAPSPSAAPLSPASLPPPFPSVAPSLLSWFVGAQSDRCRHWWTLLSTGRGASGDHTLTHNACTPHIRQHLHTAMGCMAMRHMV